MSGPEDRTYDRERNRAPVPDQGHVPGSGGEQLRPIELPGPRLGRVVEELDLVRRLIRAQRLAHVGPQSVTDLVPVPVDVVDRDDDRLDALSALRIGNAGDGDLAHERGLRKRDLDLRRTHAVARSDD